MIEFLRYWMSWAHHDIPGYIGGIRIMLRERFQRRTPINELSERQDGKVFIVTGGTRGIGAAIVERLLRLGAYVVFNGRTKKNHPDLQSMFRGLEGISGKFAYFEVQMENMDEVAEFCDEICEKYEKIDGIICNAGIMGRVEDRRSVDNFNPVFAINHLSHVVLLNRLMRTLNENSRIVLNSTEISVYRLDDISESTFRNPSYVFEGYGKSKGAQLAFMKILAPTLYKRGITINAVNPGPVLTTIGTRNSFFLWFSSFILKSADEGASMILKPLEASFRDITGAYLTSNELVENPPGLQDTALLKDIFDDSVNPLQKWLQPWDPPIVVG